MYKTFYSNSYIHPNHPQDKVDYHTVQNIYSVNCHMAPMYTFQISPCHSKTHCHLLTSQHKCQQAVCLAPCLPKYSQILIKRIENILPQENAQDRYFGLKELCSNCSKSNRYIHELHPY